MCHGNNTKLHSCCRFSYFYVNIIWLHCLAIGKSTRSTFHYFDLVELHMELVCQCNTNSIHQNFENAVTEMSELENDIFRRK